MEQAINRTKNVFLIFYLFIYFLAFYSALIPCVPFIPPDKIHNWIKGIDNPRIRVKTILILTDHI